MLRYRPSFDSRSGLILAVVSVVAIPGLSRSAQDEDLAPRLTRALGQLESRYESVSGLGQFKKIVYSEEDTTRTSTSGEFSFARKPGMNCNSLSNVVFVGKSGKGSRKSGVATLHRENSTYLLKESLEGGAYVILDMLASPSQSARPTQADISFTDQSTYSIEHRNLSDLMTNENYEFVRQERVNLRGKSMLRLEFGPSNARWAGVKAGRYGREVFTFFVVVSPEEGWAVRRFTGFIHDLSEGRLISVREGTVEYSGVNHGLPILSRYTLKTYSPSKDSPKIRLEDGQEFTGVLQLEETWQLDKIRFDPQPDSAFTLKAFGLSEDIRLR